MSFMQVMVDLQRAQAQLEHGVQRFRSRLIVVTLVGIIASLGVSGWEVWRQIYPSGSIEERAEDLSRSLKEASRLVDQMQSDIQSRQAIVTKLRNDLATYDKLAALKKEEVEAVAQALRGEIDRNARRSFWEGVGVNFGFFFLGVIASWFVGTRTASSRARAAPPK